MKHRNLWILLAVLAVLAIILLIAIPKISGETKDPNAAESQEESAATPEPTVDPELPMDQTPLEPGEASGESAETEPPAEAETQPTEGDQSESEEEGDLEEDELPIIP